MAVYSKDNPDYVPSEEKNSIDFCYTENGHLQIYIPFKSLAEEYVILQREKADESGDYTYKIMLSTDGKGQIYEVATKQTEDGKTVFDAVEQNGQTVLNVKDATGRTLTTAIALTHENCDFAEQFMQMPELGKDISRGTTEIGGASAEFVDIKATKQTDRNAARNKIKSHMSLVAQTRPINTPETEPKAPETPESPDGAPVEETKGPDSAPVEETKGSDGAPVEETKDPDGAPVEKPKPAITPKNMDPRPRAPRDFSRPEIFEYEIYENGTGNHYGTMRNIMFPTPDGAFNIEIDMSNPGERMLVTHFKNNEGKDHPYIIALGENGKPQVTERFGHTFISCYPFEELLNRDLMHPELNPPLSVSMLEVPVHGPLVQYLENLSVTGVSVNGDRVDNPEAIDSENLDKSKFYISESRTKDEFEDITSNTTEIKQYQPMLARRSLSNHEVAQLYPYSRNREEKYLTIIQVAHKAADGSALPPTYDIVLADPTNGGRPTRHTLALENGTPHFEVIQNNLITRIQRTDGEIDEVTLPINKENCDSFELLTSNLEETFEETPTSCLLENMNDTPASEFAEYLAKTPDYSVYDRKHAGSIRNLVSYEGEVGYLYLPTTLDNPPQYLRVMQKHGSLFININGLNLENPNEATTCQILGVGTENIEGRGNFLALDLSYGGKLHRLALPVRCDLKNNINTELFYDLQTLVRNGTIQLKHIQSHERPDVDNFTYAPDMERAVNEENILGSVKLGKQTTGKGARAGQKFENLDKDELSNYTFGSTTYTGLTQDVKLEGAPELGPKQKISIYNDQAYVSTAEDGSSIEEHMLATVTRQRNVHKPDGSETAENQTVFVVMEKQITDAEGTVRQGKTLLISADYLAEVQRKNPAFSITRGVTPNADGYYEFPVQKMQITADGELSYGIKVAGREVAIATNARGSQIACQEGGIQRSAVLLNENSPMNIGFVTRILDEAYTEGTNVTIDPKSNSELVDSLLVQRIVLERREKGLSDKVVEVGIPPKEPKIRLYSAIVAQKNAKGESVDQAVNFMLNEKNEVYVYAKVGGKAPAWTRVDRARLAQQTVEAEKKEAKEEAKFVATNPALILAYGKGVSEVTIPIEMDFTQNKELLAALNGTNENPGFLHEAFDVETKEGKKSQKAYFYQANDDSDPTVHAEAPKEGIDYLPVYERTNQKTAAVQFDTLANLQTNIVEGRAPEGTLPTPEKIEDPKQVNKPAEKAVAQQKWTPREPMPNLRNCLIGGSLICVLFSVFLPGFAVVAILLAGGALVVEAQPWNAIGAAKQVKLAEAQQRLQESHKQIEKQLAKVNEKFNEAKVGLAKIEKQLANPNLKPSEKTKLQRKKEELQKEILKQQKAAAAVQTSAVVKARENLVEHQKAVIATHMREQQRKQREDYAKLRLQANENDHEHESHRNNWNSASKAERNEFAALLSRDENTLSEEERRRLSALRARFGLFGQTEASIAADESKDNEHLAQLEANLAKSEEELLQAQAEQQAAEAERDNQNPPESSWATITAENAGMANYNLHEQNYEQPVAGHVESREEVENSPVRQKKSGTFDHVR